MVRRLELAQALVSAPRLLMLDEPTIGLDPIARTSVWEHINAVRAATGMTVLVTTHYMDEADQYCDRVALMHRGRIRALGTPDQLSGRSAGPRRRRSDADAGGRLPGRRRQRSRRRRRRFPRCPKHPPHRVPGRLTPPAPWGLICCWPAARPHGLARAARRVAAMCVGRTAEAAPRPHRALHPGGPARPLAADLRRDVHPDQGHPDRWHSVHRLSGARHHRPVRDVHRHLLRHHDHLGAGRRHPHQASGHPHPAGRADHRQGIRGRGQGADPGGRRDRHRRAARGGADLEPAAAARRGRARDPAARPSSPACR